MTAKENNDDRLDTYDFNSVVQDVLYLHGIVQGLNLKAPSPFDMACIRKTSVEIALAQKHLSEIFKRLSDLLGNDSSVLNVEIEKHDKLMANRIAYQQHFIREMDELTKDTDQCDTNELNRRLKEVDEIYSKSIFKLIDERAVLIYNKTIATLSNAIYLASHTERLDFHKKFEILDRNAMEQTDALNQKTPVAPVKSIKAIRFENCLVEMIDTIASCTIQELQNKKRKASDLLRSKEFEEVFEEGEAPLLRFFEILDEQILIKKMRLPKMANKTSVASESSSLDQVTQPPTDKNTLGKLGYTFCPHCSSRVYDFTTCACFEQTGGIPGVRKFRQHEPSPWRENAVRHLEEKD